MNALTYTSNPQAAAPPAVRDPFAAPFALVARLADRLRRLASRRTFAYARATQEARRPGFSLLVLQASPEGATEVVEPSRAELLERLAALRENIRRARERCLNGAADLDKGGAGEFPSDAGGR